MLTGSVLFLFGIVILTCSAELPSVLLCSLIPVCMFAAWRFRYIRGPAWCVCGFLWALLRADLMLAEKLTPDLEGKYLVVTGKVISMPVITDNVLRFDFFINRIISDDEGTVPAPGKVRLNWYRDYPLIAPGEEWQIKVRLKRPYGLMNPGGFDYEGSMFSQGFKASGYVVTDQQNGRLQPAEGEFINRLRFYLKDRLISVLPEETNVALLPALAVGDRSAMSSAQWQVLSLTGTNHLLAISGLHIGLVAVLAYWVGRWLWSLGGVTVLWIPAPRVAAFTATTGAFIYTALAGFSIPTQRALIMLLVYLGVTGLGRNTNVNSGVALALFSVLIIDPFAVMAPGFWLSFGAIAVIFYSMCCRTDTRGIWWRWGRIQYLVAIGLLPLLVFWFGQIPLLSIMANLVAVPWVSLVTIPMILTGCSLLFINEFSGTVLLKSGLLTLNILWSLLEWIAGLEFNHYVVSKPALAAGVAAVAGVVILLMPRGLPGRWIGMVWLLPLLLPNKEIPGRSEFRLTILDVGQGLAAIVKTREHVLLYDTGPAYGQDFNAGKAVILPFFRATGISRVDVLVLSHGDNDHSGGMNDVLGSIPVKQILTSVPGKISLRHAHDCRDGQSWVWDGVRFEIVHPPAAGTDLHGNNRSCVLRISNDGFAALLTGDIEYKAESLLLAEHIAQLKSTIMIAPHHGSMTSSSPMFIDAVAPDFIVFPVGYRNRFGFPKQDIINRYLQRNIERYDTSRSGAIEFMLTGKSVTVNEYRRTARRFWHTR